MRETPRVTTIDTSDVSDEMIEKRRHPRTREFGSQELEVVYLGANGAPQKVIANLWDFSEGGLGMESPCAFAPGEEIQITGELHSPDYSMVVQAKARVAYSRLVDAEFFRIGVAFVDVSYRRIPVTTDHGAI